MEATFEKLQTELSQLTHAQEPDTLVYDVIRHRTEASNYVVYARFRDEAAFQKHQAMPFHDRLVPPILACLAKEMDLQFFDWVA
jgi:quinol monooxygenase YgiN